MRTNDTNKSKESDKELIRMFDSNILINTSPIAVMFGFIECKIKSLKLLSDGSLRLDDISRDSSRSSDPKMYYNVIIPPNDMFDWMYSHSLNFSAIILRLKKESVEKVFRRLSLELGFSCNSDVGRRDIIFVLKKPFEKEIYREFINILDTNDVRLGMISEFEARFRYECARHKRDFETETTPMDQIHQNSASHPLSASKILETKHQIISEFEIQDNEINVFGKVSKFTTQPQLVMFGTYECKLQKVELFVFDSITFPNVPRSLKFNREEIDIRIPFTEVHVLQFCDDKKIPSIFINLRLNSKNVLQNDFCLKENLSNNGFVYDIHSELESERLIKVVLKDYFAFQLIVNSMKEISKVLHYLQIEQISTSKAYNLLNSSDIPVLRKQLSTSDAETAHFNSEPLDESI